MSHRCAKATKLFSVWRRGKRNVARASIVLFVLAGSVVTKEILAQDKKSAGSISGQVTIQGKPGANLTVGLFQDSHLSRQGLITKTETDAEGRFRFSGIQSDHYWLELLSPNYVAPGGGYSKQGRRVTLPEGESVDDANWDVIPGGAISGRIIDVDGTPVADQMIRLFPVFSSAPSYESLWFDNETFKTDGTGAYRVSGIPPGQYVIGIGEDVARVTGAVSYKNDHGAADGRVGRDRYYEQTLYPGVGLREQAHIFAVSAGSELSGIDFTVNKLRRAYRVSGRVIDAETGKPVSRCHIQVGYSYANGSSSSHSVNGPSDVNDSGSFSFSGFLAGRFFVNAVFSDESDLYGERVNFEVKDGDVEGIVIKAHRGLSVTGTVAIEGSPRADALAKRSELKLKVSTADPNQTTVYVNRKVAIKADGTFKIIGLPRGPAEISASSCDVCGFFELERVEYTKVDAKNQIQLAEEGFSSDSRKLNVESDLQSVRVVLRYKAASASILCHVNVVGKLPPDVRLMVLIDSGIGKGGWSGWRDVDANGDMLATGLEPGIYDLKIGDGGRRFTKAKRITVTKNQQTKLSFTIDAGKIQGEVYR